MFRNRSGAWALILIAVAAGCSQGSGPDAKYSDLSRKVHDVIQRTQGDPSKMTAEDRRVMSDAKAYKIITPPGY